MISYDLSLVFLKNFVGFCFIVWWINLNGHGVFSWTILIYSNNLQTFSEIHNMFSSVLRKLLINFICTARYWKKFEWPWRTIFEQFWSTIVSYNHSMKYESYFFFCLYQRLFIIIQNHVSALSFLFIYIHSKNSLF